MKKYISIIIIILSTNLYAQCQEDLNGDGIANVVDIVSLVNFVLSDAVCEDVNPYGCTDPNACNFNPDATIFDNSCTYAEENYNCEDNCLYDCYVDDCETYPSEYFDCTGIFNPILGSWEVCFDFQNYGNICTLHYIFYSNGTYTQLEDGIESNPRNYYVYIENNIIYLNLQSPDSETGEIIDEIIEITYISENVIDCLVPCEENSPGCSPTAFSFQRIQ